MMLRHVESLKAVQPNVALLRLSRQQDCSRGAARRPAGGAGLLCFRSNSARGVTLPQHLLSEGVTADVAGQGGAETKEQAA